MFRPDGYANCIALRSTISAVMNARQNEEDARVTVATLLALNALESAIRDRVGDFPAGRAPLLKELLPKLAYQEQNTEAVGASATIAVLQVLLLPTGLNLRNLAWPCGSGIAATVVSLGIGTDLSAAACGGPNIRACLAHGLWDSYLEDELIALSRTRFSSMDKGDSSDMVDRDSPLPNTEILRNMVCTILVAMEQAASPRGTNNGNTLQYRLVFLQTNSSGFPILALVVHQYTV
jgi:hypothetical protein